jgi:hypothetical protein
VHGIRFQGDRRYQAIAAPYTKTRSGVGSYNDYWPGQIQAGLQEGNGTGCTGDGAKDYGFAWGEKMTLRTGGFHYGRQRIWREEPSQRKQLFFSIRNPSKAVGRFQSVWSEGTGPLGQLRIPYNARVKEYYREPMPNAGLTANRLGAKEKVILPFSNRTGDDAAACYARTANGQCPSKQSYPGTEISWFGPRGAKDYQQEALRMTPQQRDVIPNKTTQFPLGFGFPGAVTEQKGPQTVNPIMNLRPTHREGYAPSRNILNDPAPFYPAGSPAVYNTEYWINPHNIKEIGTSYRINCDGSACGGSHAPGEPCMVNGTQRPGGPNLPLGSTADRWQVERINPTVLRPTQKDEAIYQCAVWAPLSTNTWAPQRGDIPAPQNRKVTPFVQQDIDPSLINAFLANPYTMPVSSYA